MSIQNPNLFGSTLYPTFEAAVEAAAYWILYGDDLPDGDIPDLVEFHYRVRNCEQDDHMRALLHWGTDKLADFTNSIYEGHILVDENYADVREAKISEAIESAHAGPEGWIQVGHHRYFVNFN